MKEKESFSARWSRLKRDEAAEEAEAAPSPAPVEDERPDEEILEAYTLVARREGIFCEPASAASVAGVLKLHREGYFAEGATVVCTLTGHGLKDPDTVFRVTKEPTKIAAEPEEVGRLIEKIL